MTKTYNLKLVPMDKVGYKQGDILMTRQGEVTIAKGTTGKIGIKKPQRLVITSDEPIRSDEVQLNTKTNIISTFKVGGINPFKEYKKIIATYPTIPDVPQIDLSDIRRWIESGCPYSVELEVKYTNLCESMKGGVYGFSPLLTNNTVKMVWGEQNKAQPIAGENKAKDMKQTPLQKAIDIVLSMTEITESSLATPTNKALSRVYMTLQSLLPYERECFVETYNNGAMCDMHVRENKDGTHTQVHLSAHDYFTNTYKQ